MKAIEQYFPMVLFIMLYKVILTFKSVDEIIKCNMTIQIKVTEQYFPVMFIMLYKLVLTLSLWMKSSSVTNKMNATEQYFPVVLYIICRTRWF